MKADLPIQQLESVPEFEACVQMQTQVWGFADRDLVPRRMFVVANKIGGHILGAWDGPRLAGFCLALPGRRDGLDYWHSHMTAVAEPYRNMGLGKRLKLAQREAALARGLSLIEWTFDPLEIKNAYFNLEVLGAIARRYSPDLYGDTSSALQAGLPSDRLTAEWWLLAARVSRRVEGAEPPPAPICGQVEVPSEIQAWKQAGDARALDIQRRNREAFLAAFAQGLSAVGYLRRREGGVFLLGTESEA